MSTPKEENSIDEWQLRGIKEHHISMLPIYKSKRKETLEYTLSNVNMEAVEENFSIIPRTTHLYKADVKVLFKINDLVLASGDFSSSKVENESSDLGLSHKIIAIHNSGVEVYFDGLFLRATKNITGDETNLDEIASEIGVPKKLEKVVFTFGEIVNNSDDENIWRPNPHYWYYTINEVNWKQMEINRIGNAQVKIVLNDPKYMTFYSWGDATRGKDFDVYLGDEETIHQMLGHDYFIYEELVSFINFFNEKIDKILEFQTNIVSDFGGILSSPWRILEKNRKWSSVKETMRSIYQILDYSEKGKFFSNIITAIIEKKIAYHNIPITIWEINSKPNPEEKTQISGSHFWEIKYDDGKLVFPDSAQKPIYESESLQLKNKIDYLSEISLQIYERVRDLLTAFQTEFSLYAVWLAIIAVILTILPIALSSIKSLLIELKNLI